MNGIIGWAKESKDEPTSLSAFLNSSFRIGSLTLPNRLIQGPLAGYSCAPFRQLFYRYTPPAYCVSEMISSQDVLHKHQPNSRYLYRAREEARLCYQLSGHDPAIVAAAAVRLQALGADLIDLNSGCPKAKIRKKNAGSALLDTPARLLDIIRAVRNAITTAFSVKIRITGDLRDVSLAKDIEQAGADALIVHGRRWIDDYDVPSNLAQIARIKQAVSIPVIANGDIADSTSLINAIHTTGCDAYMIARAGCGHPWLYQELLNYPEQHAQVSFAERVDCFMMHLDGLANLESEHQAVLQSKSLVRYYFRDRLGESFLRQFYALDHLQAIKLSLLNSI